ncbi:MULTISPECIES: hypothetical protein [unclassified Salinibacterium]|uniref:hypothetical protein n=1 Tax=unclassified Salinibacterium TaxID=2632331 RepID=UPI0018CCF415|nr:MULTISPECIES: hypothetical protein [unclassified Salinibacterium]MBH0052901.1 hypothetical protein [Salinibacterium sp. SWN139]MBH0082169.1 hypothetical protein [Salinibacterium sp. SWN167]
MNTGCDENSVTGRRHGGRVTAAAASALIAVLALAGCVPSGSTSSTSSSSVPTASSTPSSTPLPTPEPLIIPGCDTLLPLSTAKGLLSTSTQKLDEQDSFTLNGGELPEIAAVMTDATIAKNCIWGVPNSDGYFSVAIGDIAEPDLSDLKGALAASGYQGTTINNVATLEFTTENEIGTTAATHLFTGDLWIHATGTSVDLTNAAATAVLDQMRLANPTRTY